MSQKQIDGVHTAGIPACRRIRHHLCRMTSTNTRHLSWTIPVRHHSSDMNCQRGPVLVAWDLAGQLQKLKWWVCEPSSAPRKSADGPLSHPQWKKTAVADLSTAAWDEKLTLDTSFAVSCYTC